MQPKNFLTPQEYLAIERKAHYKSEYWNGQMYAMAGASFLHNVTQFNMLTGLGPALLRQGCQPIGSALKVRTASGMYTYPDLVVVCGKPQLEDDHGDVLLNPVLIFEILSPSTEKYDRGFKFQQYRGIESLREYLMVSSESIQVERYTRKSDGSWSLLEWNEPEDVVPLESCGGELKLTSIYQNVDFSS